MLTPNDLVEKDLVKKGLDASSTHPESSKVVAATGGEVGLATIAVPLGGTNAQSNRSTTEVVLVAMEPAPAVVPAVVAAVVSAPIVVSVDENLLALLRGESEQKSPAQKISPTAMSASAGAGALSSIGGSPLSEPVAPSVTVAVLFARFPSLVAPVGPVSVLVPTVVGVPETVHGIFAPGATLTGGFGAHEVESPAGRPATAHVALVAATAGAPAFAHVNVPL